MSLHSKFFCKDPFIPVPFNDAKDFRADELEGGGDGGFVSEKSIKHGNQVLYGGH